MVAGQNSHPPVTEPWKGGMSVVSEAVLSLRFGFWEASALSGLETSPTACRRRGIRRSAFFLS